MRVVQKFAAGFFLTTVSIFTSPLLAFEDATTSAGASAVSDPLYAVMPPKDFADVKLATNGTVGGQSSVAVNPKNPNEFVAAYAAGGSCWVRTSTNAGQTWAAAKKLPMPARKPNCGTPAVTWAPDGSRVYAAYSYRSTFTDKWGDVYTKEAGVEISSSINKGLSWFSPRAAAIYTNEYDIITSLKLSTSLLTTDAAWVYLLIGNFNYDDDYYYFTRSSNRGQNWGEPKFLVASNNWTGVTTPSIAGGLGGELLITWGYSTCFDLPCPPDEIQVNRSGDHGATFQRKSVAVPDSYGETAVAFGGGGTAHLIYTDDDGPAGAGTYYVYSTKAPYTNWSAPIALNDDLSANHYYLPAMTASPCGSGTSVLHAVWVDDRAGSGKYNVYYTRKVAKTGEPWSTNLRVSGTSPLYYDYPLFTPSIAAGVGTAVGLWGQKWNDGPHPVWTSRIAPGVDCP